MNIFKKNSNMSFYFLLCFFGLVVHIVYQIVFYINNVDRIAQNYNIISILIFSICTLVLIKKDSYIALLVAFIEVSVFSTISVITIGWIYEFQLWLIAVSIIEIIAPFKKYKKFFYVLAILNAIVYAALYIYVFTEFNTKKIFNVDVFFCITNVMATFFLIFFSEKMLKLSNILEKHTIKQEYDKMEQIANIDELTGIANRRKMKDILADNNILVGKEESEFYIAFADIDDFKNINDTYGHDVGDYVLKYVANFLKTQLGKENIVARWGGEEFLILFASPTTKLKVSEKLEHIRYNLSQNELKHDNNTIKFTMTFGAVSSIDFKNIYDMAKKADELMYVGKNTGKNKVVI